MEEKRIYKYAFYTIDEKDYYQYLPTSNIQDTIYVDGMKFVYEKQFIKDGAYFIDVTDDSKRLYVGENIRPLDIIKRYYAGDPIFQNLDLEMIEYLKSDTKDTYRLFGNGELSLGYFKEHININYGDIPDFEVPHDIVKAEPHWYLELHHSDGTITYEKTLYDDKKFGDRNVNFIC